MDTMLKTCSVSTLYPCMIDYSMNSSCPASCYSVRKILTTVAVVAISIPKQQWTIHQGLLLSSSHVSKSDCAWKPVWFKCPLIWFSSRVQGTDCFIRINMPDSSLKYWCHIVNSVATIKQGLYTKRKSDAKLIILILQKGFISYHTQMLDWLGLIVIAPTIITIILKMVVSQNLEF